MEHKSLLSKGYSTYVQKQLQHEEYVQKCVI